MNLATLRTAIADHVNATGPAFTVYAHRQTHPDFPCVILTPVSRTRHRTAAAGEKVGLVATIYVSVTDSLPADDATLDALTDSVPALLEAVTGAGISQIVAPTVVNWRDIELNVDQTITQLLAADVPVSITTT